MASSSSSHKQNRESNAFSEMEPAGNRAKVFESSRLFDVFINHRGPDVKETLATELYNSLRQLGIEAFLDSQEKEIGKSFPSTIETAISSAKLHIAIFSPRYAESPWCLAELLLMIESKVKIIPVFYEVEPWELRHIEKGRYAGAFIEYEKKGRYLQKLTEWKEALQTLSFIAGVEFHSFSDYKTIIAQVEKEVLQSRRCLHVAKYPVGLNNLVEDFERRCLDELVQDFEHQCGLAEKKNRPNVVGIFGMGGVGKTTLAKELFNRKLSEYSRASFLFDVREASARGGLPRLQSKLVKDLFHKEETFTSIEEGTSYLNSLLTTIPLNFLIVVDDIDHVEQLEALLVMDTLNKSGNSLIIVTTRDVGVMISTGITIGYPLKGMDRNNGRQLFCWHAFDHSIPSAGYEALVEQFVDVCGGLPLSLLVLGRHVHGRDLKFWESNVSKARRTLPRDVKQRLRISFDALEDEEKQVFMDMVCFLLWEPKRIVVRILEGSGWGAQTALQTLKDKCLIEEIGDYYRMHDHLRDLGREMALELSPPHRLWRPQDLQSIELMGLQNILAKTDTRCFHSFFDNSMGYQVRFFLGQSDSCVESSASLLWLKLEWYDYMTQRPSLLSLPAWIPLQRLQRLVISGGSFKTLWENHPQIFPHQHQLCTSCRGLQKVSVSGDPIQLRELIIIECPELEELPSLSRLSCMEKIKIEFCEKLKTITLPTALTNLSIAWCVSLQRVSGNGHLVKLTKLIINYCPQLEELPSLSRLRCMEKIEIEDCGELKTITLPTTLTSLSIKSCFSLQRVSGNGDLVKLTELIISRCPELEELPSLSRLRYMEKIEIRYCEKLNSITLPTILTKLSLRNCKTLQRVSGNGEFVKLTELYIIECPEFEEIGCTALIELTELIIRDNPQLEESPSLSRLSRLEKVEIDSCEKLHNIMLPATVISLYIHNCRVLKRVVRSGDLINLTELFITECPQLEELPCLSRQCCIVIDFCEKLKKISGIEELPALQWMRLGHCSNALIRNCIHNLKNVPSQGMMMIGRAVGGAEPCFNKDLFCDCIGVDEVIENSDYETSAIFSPYSQAIVVCYLVIVDSSDLAEDINENLSPLSTGFYSFKVRQGEWIITISSYWSLKILEYGFGADLSGYGIIKKRVHIKVKKGEEWKIMALLNTIAEKLHQGDGDIGIKDEG